MRRGRGVAAWVSAAAAIASVKTKSVDTIRRIGAPISLAATRPEESIFFFIAKTSRI